VDPLTNEVIYVGEVAVGEQLQLLRVTSEQQLRRERKTPSSSHSTAFPIVRVGGAAGPVF
jgi:hypothetical protein